MRRFNEHLHSDIRVFATSGLLAACAYGNVKLSSTHVHAADTAFPGATIRLSCSCISAIWKARHASPRVFRVLLACTGAHLVCGALNFAELAGLFEHSLAAVFLLPGLLQNALLVRFRHASQAPIDTSPQLFRFFLSMWKGKAHAAFPSLIMLYCIYTGGWYASVLCSCFTDVYALGGTFIVFFYVRQYDDLRSIDGLSLMVYRTLHVLCSFFLCLSLSFVVFKPHAPVMGKTSEKAVARLSRLSLFLEISTLALVLVPLVPSTFVSAPIFLDLLPSVAQSQVRMHAGFWPMRLI
jgi:hypothetical protein